MKHSPQEVALYNRAMQMYTENRIAALHPGMNRQIGYTAKEAIYADKVLGPVRFNDGSVGTEWDNWAARIPFSDARLRDATVAWTSNQVTAMKQQVQEVLRWETVLDKF